MTFKVKPASSSNIKFILPARLLRLVDWNPNKRLEVRLRITRAINGSIDGIQLDHFEAGQLYDVGTAIGSYLLAIGAAEPVVEEGPTLVVPSVRWEAKDKRIPLTRLKKSHDPK